GACSGGHCTPPNTHVVQDVVPDQDLTIAVGPSYAISSAYDTPYYTPNGASSAPLGTPYGVFSPSNFVSTGMVNSVTDTLLSGGQSLAGMHGNVPLNGIQNLFRTFVFDNTQWQTALEPAGSTPACDPVNF